MSARLVFSRPQGRSYSKSDNEGVEIHMDKISMNTMLSDLHRLAAQAQSRAPAAPATQPAINSQGPTGPSDTKSAAPTSFGSLFTMAVNEVNNQQMNAGRLKKAFEAGAPGVDLPQVMVASQKASVSFEALLEVRKHLLKAYQDVMSMQV